MKRINKWYLAFICMLFLNACSDDKGDSMSPETEREKVKLAVILPQDQNGTDWNRVLNWVKQNIQQANRRIEPEYEFYDENTVDLETVAKDCRCDWLLSFCQYKNCGKQMRPKLQAYVYFFNK